MPTEYQMIDLDHQILLQNILLLHLMLLNQNVYYNIDSERK